ncbi:hypothetical protein EJP77_18490 [Paenibacillus zeisoli]|uniref:Uncharacterized protein n=1 Tax=Paenibacillus zeisoli TaxID=2496267 RepID=A0A3S1B5D0_9BACL|nr:hypothetical protein [Paenibacillus zeisoli]RUT28005.1 hypothetical protein EJP77_18490 [Paenibacillus zeisoli]
MEAQFVGNQERAAYTSQSLDVMSVKQWVGTMLLLAIPVVNVILLFVWAFGGGNISPNKKNYSRAALLIALIGIGIYVVLFLIVGAIVASILPRY